MPREGARRSLLPPSRKDPNRNHTTASYKNQSNPKKDNPARTSSQAKRAARQRNCRNNAEGG